MTARRDDRSARRRARPRARAHSPFLREALPARARPCRHASSSDGAERPPSAGARRRGDESPKSSFAAGGSASRWRSRSATLPASCRSKQVTAAAVRLRRPGDRPRARRARFDERVPVRSRRGLRGHRAGQARQPRAQLFVRRRSAAAVRSRRRCRGASATMPGEAAVRIGRRMIELLQKRTADGYVARVDLRLRPSPEVDADRAAGQRGDLLLRIERACRGSGRPSSAPAPAPATSRSASTSCDAIEPFVWRRSLDFGVIEEIRAIRPADPRSLCARRQTFGPGYDLKRGRGGIREVEFFTQIQQMIHGGRDPALRVPATLDALAALARRRASRRRTARRLWPTPIGCCAPIEHRVQMIDDAADPSAARRRRGARRVARLHGLATAATSCSTCFGRTSSAVGSAVRRARAGQRAAGLSSDPDMLRGELATLGFADADSRGAADRRVALGPGALAALAGGARRVRSDAPGLLRAIAGGADPDHALNRLSDIVERLSSGVNLYRLLEARPRLGAAAGADPRPCAGARRPARAAARAARRADRRVELRPAAAGRPNSPSCLARRCAGKPYDLRARPGAADGQRAPLRARRAADRPAATTRSRSPPAMRASPKARWSRWPTPPSPSSRRRTAAFAGGELLILGLGRLGGGVLTHASDLDLIYLFTAARGAIARTATRPLGPADYFNRLANRVTAALSVPTAAGPLYDVDTRLRPQGAQGHARGVAARRSPTTSAARPGPGSIWRCAAPGRCSGRTPARDAVAGDRRGHPQPAARSRQGGRRRGQDARRDGAPQAAAGPLDIKLGPGGLVDLEFAVHVLQLTRRAGLDPRLEARRRAARRSLA